jgi:hypothetical protein
MGAAPRIIAASLALSALAAAAALPATRAVGLRLRAATRVAPAEPPPAASPSSWTVPPRARAAAQAAERRMREIPGVARFIDNLALRATRPVELPRGDRNGTVAVLERSGWWDGLDQSAARRGSAHDGQFYSWRRAGGWEPSTMRVFDQELPPAPWEGPRGSGSFSEPHAPRPRPVDAYVGFGAWVGPTALFAARRTPRVLALDADPWAYFELKANFALNGLLGAGGAPPGADPGANFEFPRAAADPRCVSSRSESLTMGGVGDSASMLKRTQDAGVSGRWRELIEGARKPEWTATCAPLPAILDEYALPGRAPGDGRRLFVKMDAEGAESFILPSLAPWLDRWDARAEEKPTLFVSMHDAADEAQRAAIAALLNRYRFFAHIAGREAEPRTPDGGWGHRVIGADGVGPDASCGGATGRGVPLTRNAGDHFRAETVCSWCDYLLTDDDANSRAACGRRR